MPSPEASMRRGGLQRSQHCNRFGLHDGGLSALVEAGPWDERRPFTARTRALRCRGGGAAGIRWRRARENARRLSVIDSLSAAARTSRTRRPRNVSHCRIQRTRQI
ncbi:hypothetical protein MTO96_029381 [Rhipicephalus appendiculatus]